MPPLDIVLVSVLAVGANARLTRLAARDTITAPLRERLIDPDQRDAILTNGPIPPPRHPRWASLRLWLYELATCPWCISMWIAVPVATAAVTLGTTLWFTLPAAVLTLSHITGWLSTNGHL